MIVTILTSLNNRIKQQCEINQIKTDVIHNLMNQLILTKLRIVLYKKKKNPAASIIFLKDEILLFFKNSFNFWVRQCMINENENLIFNFDHLGAQRNKKQIVWYVVKWGLHD